MKKIISMSIAFFFAYTIIAQNKLPVKFTYNYASERNHNNIKLVVHNVSAIKLYYYTIGVQALTDTGWVGLNGDINSLGQNDFLKLNPIKSQGRFAKIVSKKKILDLYKYDHSKKIRLSMLCCDKQDLDSNCQTIYLPAM